MMSAFVKMDISWIIQYVSKSVGMEKDSHIDVMTEIKFLEMVAPSIAKSNLYSIVMASKL